MRRSLLPLLCGAVFFAIAPAEVQGHAIETELHLHDHADLPTPGSRKGDALPLAGMAPSQASVTLQSHFSNGQPVRDAAVRLIPASGGGPIELGRTDASGRLAFALPRQAGGNAELEVDGGPGHRDWVELPGSASIGQQARRPPLPVPGVALALVPLAGLGMLGGVVLSLRRRSRS